MNLTQDQIDSFLESGFLSYGKILDDGEIELLHYTAPNTTDRQRRAFAIHFMQPGTRQMHDPTAGGRILHAGFGHPVLRMSL